MTNPQKAACYAVALASVLLFGAAQAAGVFAPAAGAEAARIGVATHASGTPGQAIPKSPDGHYWAQATVNDRPLRFLVDTGATTVALTPTDAARLGFRAENLHYFARVDTAGGPARVAFVTLASVDAGGARLENVKAVVVENGLDISLLGMSYLGRLSRFDATPERMVLQR